MVVTVFNDEKVRMLSDFRRRGNFVDLKCGCTSRKYGDTPGKLRVYANGRFMISCECTTCYRTGNVMTPSEFEKHSSKEGTRNWTKHIWVERGDKKVPVSRTVLPNYYKFVANTANGTCMSQRKRNIHRDEFIRCASCNKERRFRLRNKEECRIYHDALNKRRWKCGEVPYEKMTCDDVEERASRKNCRGCPRSPSCKGCITCVCLGCLKCRFLGCTCRTCLDFMHNAEP